MERILERNLDREEQQQHEAFLDCLDLNKNTCVQKYCGAFSKMQDIKVVTAVVFCLRGC